jgi:pyruvate dehydrogenase E1 component alpha subunit
MAGLWKLPIVYICENNQYGMGTDFRRVSAVNELSKLAASYNMPGARVDGMDVLAVYQSVTDAVKLARERSKPSLLEIRTYRYLGHSMSDPATYRTKKEVAKYKSQDPIAILRDKMTTAGMLTEDEYVAMDKDCKSIVAEAIDFAEQSEPPEIETLYEDVLA